MNLYDGNPNENDERRHAFFQARLAEGLEAKLYPYAIFDSQTREMLATVTIEGPISGEGVLATMQDSGTALFGKGRHWFMVAPPMDEHGNLLLSGRQAS